MASWKLGPALATGNTVVLKPSARTPLSALLFAQILAEVFPPGVVNVLSGSGADIGDALVGHPTTSAAAFRPARWISIAVVLAMADARSATVSMRLSTR